MVSGGTFIGLHCVCFGFCFPRKGIIHSFIQQIFVRIFEAETAHKPRGLGPFSLGQFWPRQGTRSPEPRVPILRSPAH